MIQAVIFDMDGVLVDSEFAMRKAAILALQEWGVSAKHEDFIPFTGAGEDRFVGGVAELHGVPYVLDMKRRAYEIYLDICNEDIVCFEKIPETIERLSDMGLKIAIASAADDIKVKANIGAAGINPMYLGALVTGSDVEKKKPDPSAFLLAAKKLDVEPQHCVVIEDAVNGIIAANRAGMFSIGILSSFSEKELTDAGATFLAKETYMIPELIRRLD
ncbi:MAG: HAD-IA family hydrolase [Clostridia bacterium]|nr:HAD-IA family hydrolase [Clostridia bacterium]